MSERMQELSAGPTATDWTAAPARVVLRLGGTPRSATLALGGVVAAIAAILMFRAAASAVLPLKILTPGELASLMEVPVVGNTSMSRATEPGDGVFRFASHTLRSRTGGTPILRLGTRGQVVFVTHAAELVIAIAAGACLLSIAAEPALATQVLADPFGTLSEVVGRYLG